MPPELPRRPIGRSIGGPGRVSGQGMIAAGDNIVDSNGNLTPVAYRFLHGLFDAIAKIEARLTAAGIP